MRETNLHLLYLVVALCIFSTTNAWGRQLCSDYPDFYNAYIPKQFGCSIRCLKNSQSSNTKNQLTKEQTTGNKDPQFRSNEGHLK